MNSHVSKYQTDRRLAGNFAWSLLGTVGPQLVALYAIPQLIEGLGTARFGILTLAWMVVGYFSLFDFGLGRALTKLVAEKLGSDDADEIPAVVWTAMAMMGGLGILGALVIIVCSPWLTSSVFNIAPSMRSETLSAFYLLGFSVPIVISTIGFRGVLEAHQRFDVINYIRFPMGVMTFIGPLLVLPYSTALDDVVLVLVITRVVAWAAYVVASLKLFAGLRDPRVFSRLLLRRLLAFGGWMTVSNITAPLLLYLGRVLIIVMISAEAVAYFATPYEVVVNLLVIPSMLISVLFPELSSLFQKDTDSARHLYHKGLIAIVLIMTPITIVAFLAAKPALAWWINAEFSLNGYVVAQLLAVGIFINSFGHLGQALIQSYGRPDLTAKLHVAELILYVPYLWLFIDNWGIIGAAAAWTLRVTISTLALAFIANRCLSGHFRSLY